MQPLFRAIVGHEVERVDSCLDWNSTARVERIPRGPNLAMQVPLAKCVADRSVLWGTLATPVASRVAPQVRNALRTHMLASGSMVSHPAAE